jgi:polysaccharide biosynthesis/export protein
MQRLIPAAGVLLITTITLALCAAQAAPERSGAGNPEAQSTNPVNAPVAKPESDFGFERYPRYQLRADDVLDISFEFTPEFNQTVTVQPDGYVTLRGLGDVHVAGLTVPKLTQTIRAAYARILADPAVAVVLKDFEKPYFVVNGQVGRPGKYDLRGDTTLTEAIAMAGGFNTSAKHSQVVLFRPASQGWYEAKLINVKKMLKTRNLTEQIYLKPGDMLFVPQSALSKIRQFVPNPGIGLGTTF